MVQLVDLARRGLTYLAREEHPEVGRSPTSDSAPSNSPSVPAEEAASTAQRQRSPREVIRDAITVLEEGLRAERTQLSMPQQQEVTQTVQYLRKAMQGEDTNISVKAVIRDPAGRMLVLRDAYSDYWDLPGGHVQEGETLEIGLRREIQEETGMKVGSCVQQDTRMLALGGAPRPVLFYQVEYVGGQPRISEEHLGFQWASDGELDKLNLGVFKDILIPGPTSTEQLEVGDPATHKVSGEMQVPHYQVKEDGGGDGITGVGDPMTSADTHTPVGGSGRKRELSKLVSDDEWEEHLEKISTGGGQFITGEENPAEAPVEHRMLRSSSGTLKVVKGLPSDKWAQVQGLQLLSKARRGNPFVVAGYASPVLIDREGHRVNHEALVEDVPRFMAMDGAYAAVNVAHSNLTVGKLLPEFTTGDGTVHKTGVDDIGFYAVAEIRTDDYAPEIINEVIKDVDSGKLKSFSISGEASNPVFMCDERQCFYDIGKVNLREVTLCLPPEEEVITRKGIRAISVVKVGDEVYTHRGRWRPVDQLYQREVSESLVVLKTEDGVVRLTENHPVRVLQYGGQHKGTRYEFIPAGQVVLGDQVQVYRSTGVCRSCPAPVFNHRDFCSRECKGLLPNRKGKTIASGDLGAIAHGKKVRGVTKAQNPNLSGGIQTEWGRQRHLLSVTSDKFRETSRHRALKMWQNPEYAVRQASVWHPTEKTSPNKLEKEFSEVVGIPFVGNGEMVVGRKRPDFFVEPNKIIELYGDYWHQGETGEERMVFYNERGYDCLIVWESDFKENQDEVVQRVQEFVNNGLSLVLGVSRELYSGTVHNLEVVEDHTFVTPAAVLHNCEEGVNPEAKFEVISR